ncbi:hypothetical protein GCM10029964_088890 [Kibdelosporangium lantanae]
MTSSEGEQFAHDVHLSAEVSEHGIVYQAARDQHVEQHFYYEDGVRRVHRAEPVMADECPYPGLAAFAVDQSRWFFGRDALTAQLVNQLDEHATAGGMLMVVAPSGAGKSSLLRAGLVARLAGGALPGSQDWPCAVFTPTDRPMTALRDSLAQGSEVEPSVLKAALAGEPQRWVSLLRAALHADDGEVIGRRLVLIVDQFEELFTARLAEDQRRGFVEILSQLAGVHDGQPPVALVVVGLRSDFYTPCVAYPELRRALQRSQVLVGPMSVAELREAIEFPARDVGLRLEAGLIELLLKDLGARADDPEGGYEVGRLPLLAHALRATWRERHGSMLTVDGYRVSGGIQQAVATTANGVYAELEPRDQATVRTLLLRLIRVSDNGESEDTRRRRERTELVAGIDSASVDVVLDALTQGRLITQRNASVEITHDVLLRAWPRLRTWIAEDRANLLIHQRLTEATAAWERESRDVDYLYRGTRLAAVREWVADRSDEADISGSERDFVDASIERERGERERERRRGKRLRQLAVVLAILLVASVTASIVAYIQSRRAQAQFVMAEANLVRPTDVLAAVQLTLLAIRLGDSDAESILVNDLNNNARYSVNTGLNSDTPIAFSGKEAWFATSGPNNTTLLWDYSGGDAKVAATLPRTTDPAATTADSIANLAFNDAGTELTAATNRELITTTWAPSGPFDLLQPQPQNRFTARLPPAITPITDMTISADGHTAAVVTGVLHQPRLVGPDSPVTLVDLTDPGRLRYGPLRVKTQNGMYTGITSVAFSPRKPVLVTTGFDNNSIWSTDISPPHLADFDVIGELDNVVFSPDGRTLFATSSGSADATNVTAFDVGDPSHPSQLQTLQIAQHGRIDALAISEDGRTLAAIQSSRGKDPTRTVDLWDTTNQTHITHLNTLADDGAAHIAFSRHVNPTIETYRTYMGDLSNDKLAVSYGQGVVGIWNVDRLRAIGADPIKAACASLSRGSDGPEISDEVWARLPSVSRQSICT